MCGGNFRPDLYTVRQSSCDDQLLPAECNLSTRKERKCSVNWFWSITSATNLNAPFGHSMFVVSAHSQRQFVHQHWNSIYPWVTRLVCSISRYVWLKYRQLQFLPLLLLWCYWTAPLFFAVLNKDSMKSGAQQSVTRHVYYCRPKWSGAYRIRDPLVCVGTVAS